MIFQEMGERTTNQKKLKQSARMRNPGFGLKKNYMKAFIRQISM